MRDVCRLSCLLILLAATTVDAAEPGKLDYNRDIRPILSNACYDCHGPDHENRQAGLRFDQRDSVMSELESGSHAVVPGDLATSEMIARITSDDADVRMPPPDATRQLKPEQIELLKRWVAEGAPWSDHWSFTKIVRPELPAVQTQDWVRNDIDRFVLARLEKQQIAPEAEADRTTLIRRLTLDLTGLPPTPAEIDAFVADESPDAYDKVVDRLLASPRYGERMTTEWLDAARFADTHGYHIDSGRNMTPWRDWVIAAFNSNKPFNEFTIEQIAGDLLPGATVEQKIASGFNRNHMINFEGGAIPEEYLTEYIKDRVNTTGTVFLGLSIGCAQCHDHKYDPITQRDYYRMYAFFHNLPEQGLDGREGNAAPVLRTPNDEQKEQLDAIAAKVQTIQGEMRASDAALDQAQTAWEKTEPTRPRAIWRNIDAKEFRSTAGTVLKQSGRGAIIASGPNPDRDTYTIVSEVPVKQIAALRLTALQRETPTSEGPGRSPNGNIVLTGVKMQVATGPSPGEVRDIPLVRAAADFSQTNFSVDGALDSDPTKGWALHPFMGMNHTAVFAAAAPVTIEEENAKLIITLEFNSRFKQHTLLSFRVAVTDLPEATYDEPDEDLDKIISMAADERSPEQATEIKDWYRSHFSVSHNSQSWQLAALEKSRKNIDKNVVSCMVMKEMRDPRETFILNRGQYNQLGEKVTAGTPAALPPLPEGVKPNRLALAHWLVSDANPLTARVIVNRYWQMYFGDGIVRTSEDFGSQGEWPSHLELLDWLAREFEESGWDVKHMQRLIVTSATYRQNSRTTPDKLAIDPDNRLLAHGPRVRLKAEFIRDLALSASGLLDTRIGGASVSPYQPSGLWEECAIGKQYTAQCYVQSHGPDLYRRGMYTFWKRTIPPVSLSVFDAPDRETCAVRRLRTNTPLQALALWNDPTYVEASRKLAERVMRETEPVEDRIRSAFRLLAGRAPSENELEVLTDLYDSQHQRFVAEPEAASELLTVGESPHDEYLNSSELAAWSMVCSAILNLDETITKN